MKQTTEAIMDAAEVRIRRGGYNGFSFRELAQDVGMKSASVHYHFPTKEALAAAVAKRYRERFLEAIEHDVAAGRDVTAAWKSGFQRAVEADGGMCLCGALGAAADALPEAVRHEACAFFNAALVQMTTSGLSHAKATQIIASLEGAMLLANSLGRADVFADATLMLG
ncbi:MAG: helix-turn-helix transcriptional regulator [Rhizobium sp.]|jgi:TetR/AcrR family transcriptional repressor of nem operon|nr:helix-turn-helix transcriptional regulator [Rhizobium sp.]